MRLPEEKQSTFLVCTFSILRKIAEADGEVSKEEISRIEQYIDEKLPLSKKLKKLCLRIFHEAAESPLDVRDYARTLSSTYPDSVTVADQIVQILLEFSAADGRINHQEDRQIHAVALLLGLTEPGYFLMRERVLENLAPLH